MLPAGLAAIAALCLIVGLYLKWQKAAPKLTSYLMLVAGVGIAGFVGLLLSNAISVMVATMSAGTRALFGVALPIGLAIVFGVSLWLHLFRPRSTPTRATPWVALLFGPMLGAAGLGALVALAERGVGAASQLAAQLLDQIIGSL